MPQYRSHYQQRLHPLGLLNDIPSCTKPHVALCHNIGHHALFLHLHPLIPNIFLHLDFTLLRPPLSVMHLRTASLLDFLPSTHTLLLSPSCAPLLSWTHMLSCGFAFSLALPCSLALCSLLLSCSPSLSCSLSLSHSLSRPLSSFNCFIQVHALCVCVLATDIVNQQWPFLTALHGLY